jgi:dolichol-phosphate mannosyltransferase
MTRPASHVPAYRIALWRGRRFPYCVVIPVLNEGERLALLLDRMTALGIAERVDILIVDGGSHDGSVEHAKLACVQGLLVKTGPGKLSAQLRCGYAYALDQGYEGIVTIDGNNKDDPEAVPRFIAALKEGWDFVQASRYVQGGVAENTPRMRELAIRWIHAPLLSLSSGFRWTDTTQGFRAYSARLLRDPRIAPFRDIFDTYELLAYLSYRAPRLGYRCIELPTARRYPRGMVPTKISRVGGSLTLLKILLFACLGFYNA